MLRIRLDRALASLVLGSLGLLGACGGGGGGGGGGGPGITGIAPSSASSEAQSTLTVQGSGFGLPGPATVRLTAASGTPFTGGTAAFLDIPGTVVSDSSVTFTSPPTQLTSGTSVAAAVRVTLPSLTVYNSAGSILTLTRPTFVSITPNEISATTPTLFTITGTGFGPSLGTASITFTATTGTPFAGFPSTTVTGTILSANQMTGTSPVATTLVDFTASILITFAGGSTAPSGPAVVEFVLNFAPTITTNLAPGDLRLAHGDRVSFTVTSTDPEASAVGIRLLNPPPGLTFRPIVGATSPATATVEWVVDAMNDPGLVPLVFRTTDGAKSRDFTVWTHLTPGVTRTMLVGEVTGDTKNDVVVVAHKADVGSAVDAGAIYVWAGALVPSGTPTATLTVSGAASSDQLGSGGIRLADFNGDGILDIIAASDKADIALTTDRGAIYVWFGGVALFGPKFPDVTLTVGAAVAGSGASMGLASQPLLWQIGDVDNDGKVDIVACAPTADVGIFPDAGALYVWTGGVGTGIRNPNVTLRAAVPAATDRLGLDGLQLADLTGEGVLDVFSSASNANSGAGAMYMWKGGATLIPPGLNPTKNADATMTASTGIALDGLGTGAGSAIALADVTNDGVKDVVTAVDKATVGSTALAGAIYVFKGGATLTGSITQNARLFVSGALPGDGVGAGPATRLLVGDVSGDGISDVVGVAPFANVPSATDGGALYVWKGSGTLAGDTAQDATLLAPSPAAVDNLGSGGSRLADVTNDGVLDVVSAAPLANVGVANSGAVYVWAGGGTLTGTPTATRLTVPGAIANDQLAGDSVAPLSFTLRFADVTGDKALDLLVPAVQADVGTIIDAGAIYVWKGGATLTGTPAPTATLTVTGAFAADKLGNSSGAFVAAADVNGDGVLDVVSAASLADRVGLTDAGAIYVWNGGATLVGPKNADATLRVPTAFNADQLGGGTLLGVNWDLVEVTGDTTRDVVATAPLAETATLVDAGAGYVWEGLPTLTGVVAPTATLLAPNRSNIDALGRSGTTGNTYDLLLMADVTGDGTADVLVGASEYAGLGPTAKGGVFLWQGGAFSATPASTPLLVPGAAAQDRLGN